MKPNIKNSDLFIFFFALATAAAIFFAIKTGSSLIQGDTLNILVLGIDTRQGWQARSDSINLVHIDFSRNRIGILSIPRDTLVDIPGFGQDKINHAHMFGGPELTCRTVSNFLQLPVNNYIEANFPLFINIIDELGGININVEKPLYYDDYAGNLHIHLPQGEQKLDGYEAMGYVRFRHDNTSDWGRIERQHKFFEALSRQLLQPSTILRLPSLMTGVSSNVRTNMSVINSLKVAFRAPSMFRTGHVEMGVIPGGDAHLSRGYYMLSNKEGMKEAIDRVIYGVNETK